MTMRIPERNESLTGQVPQLEWESERKGSFHFKVNQQSGDSPETIDRYFLVGE